MVEPATGFYQGMVEGVLLLPAIDLGRVVEAGSLVGLKEIGSVERTAVVDEDF